MRTNVDVLVLLITVVAFAARHMMVVAMGRPRVKTFNKVTKPTSTPNQQVPTPTEEHINLVRSRLEANMPALLTSFEKQGYAYIDNFLGYQACKEMRDEAEKLYNEKYYTLSQSTRFDLDTNEVVTYNKYNVYSMQLDGGSKYEKEIGRAHV